MTERAVADFRIGVHGQGVEMTRGLADWIEQRLRRHLRPYAGRIVAAYVRLWAPPEGEQPAVCHLRVELRPTGGLALGEAGLDAAAAVERASLRMAAALGVQLARPQAASSHTWFRT